MLGVIPRADIHLRRHRRMLPFHPRGDEVDVPGSLPEERRAVVCRPDGEDLGAAARVGGDLAAQRPGREVVAPRGVGLPGVDGRVRDGVAFSVLDVEDEQERAVPYAMVRRGGVDACQPGTMGDESKVALTLQQFIGGENGLSIVNVPSRGSKDVERTFRRSSEAPDDETVPTMVRAIRLEKCRCRPSMSSF